ncbi:hypothetical protein ACFLY6_01700 [Candidatus Dependentiae bacterium]
MLKKILISVAFAVSCIGSVFSMNERFEKRFAEEDKANKAYLKYFAGGAFRRG